MNRVDNPRLLNHNTGMCCCVWWLYVWESCSEAALNPELALFVGPAVEKPDSCRRSSGAYMHPSVAGAVVCGCAAVS